MYNTLYSGRDVVAVIRIIEVDRFIDDINVLHVLGDCSRLCMVTVLQ